MRGDGTPVHFPYYRLNSGKGIYVKEEFNRVCGSCSFLFTTVSIGEKWKETMKAV